MTSKHSQAPCMTDLITVASLPICVYVSTGAQRSGAETAGCPPPRFTLRLDFPLEKRWKSSFPLHSFFEMTCSSLWPADQQETSAAPKKHINSCTLRWRVNRFPDTGGPLCLWGVWLLLPTTVRNSCFTPSSAIVLSPTCAEHPQEPTVSPQWLPTVPRHTAGPSLGFPLPSPRERCRGGQQLQCWIVLDKWACHSSYWLAILWHFLSKTQMWQGKWQGHGSGWKIRLAIVGSSPSTSVQLQRMRRLRFLGCSKDLKK